MADIARGRFVWHEVMTPDPKAGAAGSIYNVLTDPRLNHRVDVIFGIREAECAALLRDFFSRRRA